MKEQDNPPKKKTKWNGDIWPSRKRVQNNDSKDDHYVRKIMAKMQEKFTKYLEELNKKQTDEQYNRRDQ